MAFLELDNISVEFSDKRVLDRLSFQVGKGEHIRLTGRSGAGKSTVFKVILGFVLPVEGTVLIDGTVLDSQSVWDIRRRISYVAQEPELGEGTAREVIIRPFCFKANHGIRKNLKNLETLWKKFLLPRKLLDEDVSTLSGGEKQRAALVSALLLERDILLLDEASSALDEQSKKAVGDFLEDKKDLTILTISHDSSGFGFNARGILIPGGYEEEE